jgi:methylated-DNA-[protein]-cysteine S-methyltransferase
MKELRTFDVVVPGRGLVVRAHHDGKALHGLGLRGRRDGSRASRPSGALEMTLRDELLGYFAGTRTLFSIPLSDGGATAFQRAVWDALRAIPYGETRSYGDVARAIGQPGAARAVGAACGANPLPIVVPCHRVIAADGSLGGYSAGLKWKRALLRLEGRAE